MRKLMSKKGFTLVELMIVVVILGILVAVAIPIFGAVTKNARIKSCKSNQRVIKGNMETFQMTGAEDGGQLNITSDTEVTANQDFKNLFEGNALPTCPSAEGPSYTAKYIVADTGAITYEVKCTATPPTGEVHNVAA